MGGLASIAGINLSQSGGNVDEAIDKLKTLSFFENNILPNIFSSRSYGIRFLGCINSNCYLQQKL